MKIVKAKDNCWEREKLHKVNKDKDQIIIKVLDKSLKYVLCIIFAILFINIILNLITNNEKMKYNAFIIVSESMEPNIKVGDIILEKKVNEEELNKEDIITYKQDGKNITHRIVNIEVIDNITVYTTKGDNNKIEDEKKIVYADIRGKVVAKISFIGMFRLNDMLQKIVLITLVICIIIYIEIRKIDRKRIKRRKKKELEDELYFERNKK